MKVHIATSKDIENCPIKSLSADHFFAGGGCRCNTFHLVVSITAELDPRAFDDELDMPTIDALLTRLDAQVMDQVGLKRYQIVDNLPTPDQPIPAAASPSDSDPQEATRDNSV